MTKEYARLLRELSHRHRDRRLSRCRFGRQCLWQDHGIEYIRSELNKSAIYLEFLPLFARGLVRLPEHAKLLRELRLLERHTHRSGKDSVHPGRNGSDDHANAVCGELWLLVGATLRFGGARTFWSRTGRWRRQGSAM